MREMTKRNELFHSVWRTKWLLLLLVILYFGRYLLPENTTERLVVYKLMVGVSAAMVGHWVVKWLTPYIRLGELLLEDKKDETQDAIKFAGAAIMRGLIMGAFIIGCLLGI